MTSSCSTASSFDLDDDFCLRDLKDALPDMLAGDVGGPPSFYHVQEMNKEPVATPMMPRLSRVPSQYQLECLTEYYLYDMPQLANNSPLPSPAGEMVEESPVYSEYISLLNNPIDFQTQKVITELNFLAESWQSGAQVKIPGVDISISNASLIEDVAKMVSLRDRLLLDDEFPAKHCEDFVEHTQLLRSRIKLEREVEKLRYQLSSDALLLSEDYQNKLKVLKALGYVTDSDMVSFKGRVACEIHHQELLITELILENKLHTRSTAEVAAMLSATTCQYRAQQEAKFESGSLFAELKRDVEDVRWRLETVGQEMRVNIVDVGDDIRFDLMEIVYNWASGMPFSEIMANTDAQEGLIVRCVQRLAEVCKDVRNAARIVGDPALHEKMEQVSAAIKRDIVFAASLYTTV